MRKPDSRAGGRVRRLIGLGLLLLLLDYLLYPLAGCRAPTGNRGENGLWLRYHWYFGRRTEEEVEALGDRLTRLQVRYAYFHVRHVTRDGSLRYPHHAEARRLTFTLHRRAPGVKTIAWIYAGNLGRAPGLAEVDVASTAVRARMVEEARRLVREDGFDGVQWDYEICPDGDRDFLRLLQETRRAIGYDRHLSVAAPLWLPAPLTARWGWSDGYFQQVARECDDVCVMGYDTGLYLPRAYVALMRRQVSQVTRAISDANPGCRVLIGVPTYARGGISHHAWAENLPLAIKGVREGLSVRGAAPSVFAGIAPFADYTTQEREWRVYRQEWLDAPGK